MKVLKEAHLYEVANFEKGGTPQKIQFIEKAPNSKGEFETVNNGTTNEELLEVLIDRITSLNAKFPSQNNRVCITNLKAAKGQLELRTRDRERRGVEGKYAK